MHVSAFQRWFTVMACVATLLVMVAPLVSRKMNHPAVAPTASAPASASSAHAAHDAHAHVAATHATSPLAAPTHGDAHAMHHPSAHNASAHMHPQVDAPEHRSDHEHPRAGGNAHAQHQHGHGHDTHAAAAPGDTGAKHTASTPTPTAPAADPHAGHDMGVECDYCLIAARMLTFVVALLLALIALPPVPHLPSRAAPRRTAAPVSRLGARGPPLLAA